MTKSNEDLKVELEYSIDHLSFGNSEVVVNDDQVDVTIEAPNHTTLVVQFLGNEVQKLKEKFMTTYATRAIQVIDSFDPDDTFNELWSKKFAEHNHFTPSGFIRILEEDQQFFKEERERLRMRLEQIRRIKYEATQPVRKQKQLNRLYELKIHHEAILTEINQSIDALEEADK